jgi:hypothetical protein
MRRGFWRATACAVALAGGTMAGAAPAAAYCGARVDLPSTVSIDRPYKEIEVVLRSGCYELEYAAAHLYGPTGADDIFIWDPAYGGAVEYWDVYDWTKPGDYKTRDSWGHTYDYDDAWITEDTVRVKYGSRTSIRTTRSKKYVTVSASASRYKPADRKFRPYNTVARIEIKKKNKWVQKKAVSLGRDGKASVRIYAPSKQTWRVRIAETGSVWGRTSATSRR